MFAEPSRSSCSFFLTGALLLVVAAADRDSAKTGVQSEAAAARAKILARAAMEATMYDARAVTGIESAKDRDEFGSILLQLDEGLTNGDTSAVDKAVDSSKSFATRLAEDLGWLSSSNKETVEEVDTETVKEAKKEAEENGEEASEAKELVEINMEALTEVKKGARTKAKKPEVDEHEDEGVIRKMSFGKTSSMGEQLQTIVSKLGDHMNKDLPEKTHSSLEASKLYQSSLEELNQGLQTLEVGVKSFKKGAAKSHGDRSKAMRATLEKGMHGEANAVAEHREQPPKKQTNP